MRVEERGGDFPIMNLCLWEKYRLADGTGRGSKLGHMPIVSVQGQPELLSEILSGGGGRLKMLPLAPVTGHHYREGRIIILSQYSPSKFAQIHTTFLLMLYNMKNYLFP